MKKYLNEEDYAIAEQNNIDRKLAYTRFYGQGWSAERATTEPKNHQGYWKNLLTQAHANGVDISMSGLVMRINRSGMTEEEAITKPLSKGKDKYVVIAEKNGISSNAYYSRRSRGWSKGRASTEAINKAMSDCAKGFNADSIARQALEIEVKSPHADWW